MGVDNTVTLATEAYVKLRSEIIAGTIVPGARIGTRSTSERLKVGLSPMREALNRLASEGLVEQSDRRGFAAIALDLDDLMDLTLARRATNAAALRDAIDHGDEAWEEAVVTAHHRLRRGRRVNNFSDPGVEALHRAFHAVLLAPCRSGRLKRHAEQLFDSADRYRLVSRNADVGSRDIDQEHDEIMAAVLRRDADAAVALMDAHVERTADLARQVLRHRD